MRAAITAMALVVSLTGCGLFDSGSNWKSGRYEVLWIDLHSDSHLAYRLDSSTSIEIVESCVFAAGANDQYIAVKQRQSGSTAVPMYYVVSKADYDPSQEPGRAVIGPLSEAEFERLGKRLVLPALEPISEAACKVAA